MLGSVPALRPFTKDVYDVWMRGSSNSAEENLLAWILNRAFSSKLFLKVFSSLEHVGCLRLSTTSHLFLLVLRG